MDDPVTYVTFPISYLISKKASSPSFSVPPVGEIIPDSYLSTETVLTSPTSIGVPPEPLQYRAPR